jgi:hypothetical protein
MKNPQRLFRSIAKRLYRGENLPPSPRCLCCGQWVRNAESRRRALCDTCWPGIARELDDLGRQLEFSFASETKSGSFGEPPKGNPKQ